MEIDLQSARHGGFDRAFHHGSHGTGISDVKREKFAGDEMKRQARQRCGQGERQAVFEYLASGDGSEWHTGCNDLIRINSLLSNVFRQACRGFFQGDAATFWGRRGKLLCAPGESSVRLT